MSSFGDALREKIEVLEDELQEYEDAISRIKPKLEVLTELLEEEEGKKSPTSRKKRPGRPKGSRSKSSSSKKSASSSKKQSSTTTEDDALYREAVSTLPGGKGSSEEDQKRAIARFNPAPRVDVGSGGVKAGSKEEVLGNQGSPSEKAHSRTSIEDDEGE